MKTNDISASLATLFSELVLGANRGGGAFILNSGDAGLLRSLDKLSAADASSSVHGGATIAAHAQHVRYGLSLMNRWSQGENPFGDADWAASWKKTSVTEPEWEALRIQLRDQAARWLVVLRTPREVQDVELSGMIGSIAHLAYHMGAIRQISGDARGPAESER